MLETNISVGWLLPMLVVFLGIGGSAIMGILNGKDRRKVDDSVSVDYKK